MRISFLTQPRAGFPPRGADAIGLWTLGAARELVGLDEVEVHARRRPGEPREEELEGFRVLRGARGRGEPILRRALARLPRRRGTPAFASERYGAELARAAAARLARAPADVVHVPNLPQLLRPLRAAAPDAVLALHMHAEWLAQLPPELVRPRLAEADLVLACSEHVARGVRERFPEVAGRCHAVPNGVDVERFRPRPEPAREEGPPRLLYVGRISPEKGLHVLLEAFAIVAERAPGAVLEVVGPHAETPPAFLAELSERPELRELARLADGSYLERLRARVDPCVASRVRFRGAVPFEELPARYRRADVVVGASLSETFGQGYAEAQASGVPVVAASAGGVPEVVEDGRTGLLVPPGDASALAEAILRVALDPELRARMGREARGRAERHFAWPRVAAELRALYARARSRRAEEVRAP